MTLGLSKYNLSVDIGLFEVEHPVISHFASGPNRMMAPITLDNPLAQKTISDQIGIKIGYQYAFSDKWSARFDAAASQSKYMHMSRPALTPNIQSRDNLLSLFHMNEFYPDQYMNDLKKLGNLRDIVDINITGADLPNLINGNKPQLDISLNANLPEISKRGQHYAVFAAWLHLEHNGGWKDLTKAVDAQKLAQRYNDFRQDKLDQINAIKLPSDMQGDIINALSQIMPEDRAAEYANKIGSALQDMLDDAKGDANAIKKLTPQQIKKKVNEVVADLQGELNEEIYAHPEKYYTAYRDTLDQLQGMLKSYQTASDTPSLHANIELSYDGQAVDWRLGALWNKLETGALDGAAETRIGLYSILDWRFADKWAYQNIISVVYYQNHLGLEGLENGNVLLYNRLSYDINSNITAYIAAGGAAEGVEGAFATGEFGAQGCWNVGGVQLCAQAAYEAVEGLDIIAEKEMQINRFRDSGQRYSLSYQIAF